MSYVNITTLPHFIPKIGYSLCAALFLTPTTNSINSDKIETESKSASEHSKNLFFVNFKSISIKEADLSTKGHRHILKSQSKNEKLLKNLFETVLRYSSETSTKYRA